MPHAISDGARIHYEISGSSDKPWLMFSNSLGTNLGFWDAQAAAFGDDFHILRYDTRGHGDSDAPAGDYDFDQLGRDALAVMDAAGVWKTHFCGVSMGGTTALWLGINAAQRVETLTISNSGARIGDASIWQPRIDTALSEGIGPLVGGTTERWFTERFRTADPLAVERIRAMLLATDPVGYAGCCAALRDNDLRAQIGSIGVPSLVIAGRHDVATPPSLSQDIHAAVTGSRLVELDAAHLSNIEAEQAFNAALGAFLKG